MALPNSSTFLDMSYNKLQHWNLHVEYTLTIYKIHLQFTIDTIYTYNMIIKRYYTAEL